MSTATQPGIAEVILVLASFAVVPMVWVAMVRHLRHGGLLPASAHVVGAVAGGVTWIMMLAVGFSSGIPGIVAGACLLGAFWVLRRVSRAKPVAAVPPQMPPQSQPIPPPAAVAPAAAVPAPPVVDRVGPATVAQVQPSSDLMHLVKGMMADGVFVQEEADFLFRWLHDNRDRLNEYPYNAIYLRLDNALADGVLDEDEAADIGEFFRRLVEEPGIVDVVALRAGTPEPRTVLDAPEHATAAEHLPRVAKSATRTSTTAIDHVLIRYRDSLGIESEREVNVRACDGVNIKGYCHLRRSIRTFRLDRIVGDVVRVETGEVLPLRKWKAEVAG